MNSSAEQNSTGVNFTPPLLITESREQFASLCRELEQEIEPKNVIEQTFVHDIACITWDILRFRRYKTSIINSSRLAALRGILEQLVPDQEYEVHGRAADDLARGWFENNNVKTKVAKLLRKFQMDETAIEAEAFRLCSEDLERLDRMLTLAEVRREKALRFVADYREHLWTRLRQTADRLLESDEVPRLISVRKRSD
jgi:hypothetical protein